MGLRLPAITRSALPTAPGELLRALRALDDEGPRQGFVELVGPRGAFFLFLHEGRPYCAGAFEDERFVPRAMSEVASALHDVTEASLTHTDLPLFLCAAVMFRKAPSAHVPLTLVDSDALLRSIRALGKDAVVVIGRGDARSLVFCREGEPVALYPARDEPFPTSGSLAERILEYVYQDPGGPPVTMDLYDDIRLPPAKNAGEPLASYLVETLKERGPPASLVVELGGRVVFRFPLEEDEALIGRGEDADIILDNLSVSRRHARVKKAGERLVVEDLGSENGIFVGGERVRTASLAPGDALVVGKYTLRYAHGAAAAKIDAPAAPTRTSSSELDTISIGWGSPTAVLEHAGKEHPLHTAFFGIGNGEQATLRCGGLFIAPLHVAIVREGDGYRVRHIKGLRKLRLNGAVTKESRLSDGDILTLGGEKFVFRVPEPLSRA